LDKPGQTNHPEKSGFFSNWLGFGARRVPAEDYDNKLETLQLSSKLSVNFDEKSMESSIRSQKGFNMALDNPLYIERNRNNQFERTYLTQVLDFEC